MPTEVLLIEDTPGDVRLTREIFAEVNSCVRRHVASDGFEAMAFLRLEGVYARALRSQIIVLDLNLPKMDGREVPAQIKENPGLKAIAIVILTPSDAEVDRTRSYELQTNCYLSKPVQVEAFESLVKSINDFWLTKAKLPLRSECK